MIIIPGPNVYFQNQSEFVYYSTVFDGTNDYIDRGALTGIADSKQGTVSVWLKSAASGVRYNIICDNAISKFRLRLGSDNAIEMNADDSTSTTVLRLNSESATVTADGNWHHVICSWDLAQAGMGYCFVDGVDASHRYVFTDANIDYDGISNWGIGSAPTILLDVFNGKMSELYFTTTFIDITVGSNLQKFRSAGGKPVNLGSNGSIPTGVQPFIYLKNPFSSFQTNAGSGGDFTVTGTLDDGGSDIP